MPCNFDDPLFKIHVCRFQRPCFYMHLSHVVNKILCFVVLWCEQLDKSPYDPGAWRCCLDRHSTWSRSSPRWRSYRLWNNQPDTDGLRCRQLRPLC